MKSYQAALSIKLALAKPKSWKKGRSKGIYWFGISKCLYTVVEETVVDMDVIERRKLYNSLQNNLPFPYLSITEFNDAEKTSHNDVMAYLDRVRDDLLILPAEQ